MEKMSKKKAALLCSNTSKLPLTSSAAAEIVASNLDLVTEILIRVPAKSLIKFKSVSKQWLSLICDPQFSLNHTTHHNPLTLPSGLYFYSKLDRSLSLNDRITPVSVSSHQRTTSLPNFSFLDGSGAVTELLHSSNGLMLCSRILGGDYVVCNPITQKFSLLAGEFVVCNPTTQKFVVLPTLAHGSWSSLMFQSYLVFDPKKSPYFKVAVVNFAFRSNATRLAVYFSERGSWKSTILGPSIQYLNPLIGRGAVWNGTIILMSMAENDHFYFRIDIDAGKLTTIPPQDTNLCKEIMYFGECGDRLLLIPMPSCNATEFKVLEMIDGETNFRWIVKYVIDLTPLTLPKRKGFRFKVISVMKVGANGSDLAVVLDIRGKIVQYNIECKTLKVLCDFAKGKVPDYIIYPYMYSYHFIESLTPI